MWLGCMSAVINRTSSKNNQVSISMNNTFHELRSVMNRLLRDDRGATASMEMILIATILIIGMIVGLTTWRDAVVQELGDSAAAVAQLNQGYTYGQNTIDRTFRTDDGGFVTVFARVEGSEYVDRRDFCQAFTVDPSDQPPMCITLTVGPSNER